MYSVRNLRNQYFPWNDFTSLRKELTNHLNRFKNIPVSKLAWELLVIKHRTNYTAELCPNLDKILNNWTVIKSRGFCVSEVSWSRLIYDAIACTHRYPSIGIQKRIWDDLCKHHMIGCSHYKYVIMGTMAPKSPASRLFTQPFIRGQIKKKKRPIKAPRHWPLCGKFTGDR